MAFTLDTPFFKASAYIQKGYRADFREIVEWHDGTKWCDITGDGGSWHVNMTSVLPIGAQGGDNTFGAGATAGNIPNTRPVANAGAEQNVASQAVVTLDGSGSSDVDLDSLTYQWTQTGGPAVRLSDATAMQPTFTAPVGPATVIFQLKVSDICKSLHHHKPDNFESAGADVTINVAAP